MSVQIVFNYPTPEEAKDAVIAMAKTFAVPATTAAAPTVDKEVKPSAQMELPLPSNANITTPTLEEVTAKLKTVSSDKGLAVAIKCLKSVGVNKISAVPPTKYAEFNSAMDAELAK